MSSVRTGSALRSGLALLVGLAVVTAPLPAAAATARANASVLVLARPQAVVAQATAKGPALGRVRVAGRVTPTRAGRVVLQRRRGSSWLDVARTSLTRKGTYSLGSVGLPVGRYTLRVVEAATRSSKAVAGKDFTVSVLPPRHVVAQPNPTPNPNPTPTPTPVPVPNPPVPPAPAPVPSPPAPTGPTPPTAGEPIVCSPYQPAPASPDQLAIGFVADPWGYVGTRYGTEVWATGGVAPYTLTAAAADTEGLFVAGGQLDEGYYGEYIAGVPRAPGVFHLSVTLTDAVGATVTANLCLQFTQRLRVLTPSLPTATVGSPFSAAIATSGGFAPITLSAPGEVQSAEGLYVHDGKLTGTPGTATISSIAVTALDGAGTTATAWPTLTVGPLPAPRTLHVPGDAATISAAVADASPGDTILVGPGTYHENLDFAGKAVTVRSTAGPSHTVIEGATSAPTASFTHQEPPQAVLDGFTLLGHPEQLSAAHPQPTELGGGVDIEGASPTIENDVIGPAWAQAGSGVGIFGGAATLRHDTISGSVATENSFSDGVGVAIGGVTQVSLIDNVISNNSTGLSIGGTVVQLEGNLVTGNQYAALGATASDLTSVDDAFVRDDTRGGYTATNIPEAVNVSTDQGGSASLLNDTVADNGIGVPLKTQQGTSVRDTVVEGTADLTDMVSCDGESLPADYSDDVFWNTVARDRELDQQCIKVSATNRVADPGFQDRTHGNFTPAAGSVLIDAADSTDSLPLLDQAGNQRVVDGNGDGIAVADIGAYERQ